MLHIYSNHKSLCSVLCVLFLLLCLCAGAWAREQDGWSGEDVGLYAAEGQERGVWYICLSRGLYEVCGGGTVALRFSVKAPAGWVIGEITAAGGAEGMTLTAATSDGNTAARILLDGKPFASTPGYEQRREFPLIKVSFSPTDESRRTEMSAPLLAVEDGCMYYIKNINGKEEICTVPVYVVEFAETVCPQTGCPQTSCPQESDQRDIGTGELSEVGEGSDFPDGELTGPPEETKASPLMNDETERLPMPLFVGCQETPVRDGQFAVRFLFYATEEQGSHTPVVCATGGGVLTLAVTASDTVFEMTAEGLIAHEAKGGRWLICTFSGLSEQRSYLFLVYGEGTVWTVCYQNGVFSDGASGTADAPNRSLCQK